jgi:hypothetical protein
MTCARRYARGGSLLANGGGQRGELLGLVEVRDSESAAVPRAAAVARRERAAKSGGRRPGAISTGILSRRSKFGSLLRLMLRNPMGTRAVG